MKPRFRRLISNALPALIIVPASMTVAPAAVVNVFPSGSVEIPAGPSRPDSILADGGTSPTAPLTVTIAQGATLTGDGELDHEGVRVTYSGYTINNSGTLDVSGIGINVLDVSGTVINNEGIIKSESIDGVHAGDNAMITNKAFGPEESLSDEITGGTNGISAGRGLDLTNAFDAVIRGLEGDGVQVRGTAKVVNWGNIFGPINGINIDEVEDTDTPGILETTSEFDDIPAAQTTIDNYGDINGGQGAGIDGSSMAETVNNWGTIQADQLALNLGDGSDSIVLHEGSKISGHIDGGNGMDTLTFENGARLVFDGESNAVIDDNSLTGNVFKVESIIKIGYGAAIIDTTFSQPVDVFEQKLANKIPLFSPGIVEADHITITSGALYINGHVAPASEWNMNARIPIDEDYKTSIIADGGEIGGTNGFFPDFQPFDPDFQNITMDGQQGWQADINIFNNGGISAGSKPQDLSQGFMSESIGKLIINGSITHGYGYGPLSFSLQEAPIMPPYKPLPTYIWVDINPGTIVDSGKNSDLIVQTGKNSIYDMTGAEVWIAPTNQSQALSNGSYTIIDSERNIIGFSAETTKIGVVIKNESAPVFVGKALKAAVETPVTSDVSYDTVLGQYFSKLYLINPEELDHTNTTLASRVIPTFDVSFTESGTDLVLEIQYNFSDLPGLSENESTFGEALDQFIENEEPGDFEEPNPLNDILQDIANQDLKFVQAALATLDPSSSFGVVQSVVNSNYRLHRLTQNHLAAVRGSSKTSNEAGASAKDAKGVITAGPTTTTTTGRGNVWGTMSFDSQDFDGDLNEADFDGDTGSFTAGVDWLVAPQLILGVVFDGSKSDLDGEGSNSTDIDSFRAAAYGTWGGAKGLYSDFLVGYGDHDLDNTKSFDILGNLSSNTDASSLQALWTVGYTMGDEEIKHGPFAGFEYQRVDVDGYNQEGLVPIAVSDYDVDSFRGLIGYRVDASLGKFSPYAAAAFAHEFEDGLNKARATVGGVPFTVEGGEQSSAFLISFGTGYALTDALILDLGYRGELATDDGITSHGASLGLNYSF